MDVDEIRDYSLAKPGVEEGFPFGGDTLVFKVNNKIFLLVAISASPLQFNAKCDPERAIQLRDEFECILPGYHMNKRHWNTVIINNKLSKAQLKELIDHSYDLVNKTKKRKQ